MVKMGGKIWERLLPLSLFLALYELAAESSFYLLELSLVLLFVYFVWEERQALLHPVGTMQEGIGLLKPLLPAWGMLAAYLLWDLVTVFYSPLREGVLAKYKVVCLMLFFSALILWYGRTERRRRLRLLLQVLVAAGLTAAVLSLVNFTFPVLYPVIYGRRLSLRLDYNVFSTVVLMGLIAGSYLLGRERPLAPRCFFLYLICAPAIILSSSRRNAIFLLCFSAWQFGGGLWRARKGERRHFVGGWLAIVLSVAVLTTLLQVYLDWRYERLLQEDVPMVSSAQGSALERYEQIGQEGGSSKRMLIWSVALREYHGYDGGEKLFGKGFGYDVLLYRLSDDPALAESYEQQSRQLLCAHSFLLADLLNGGLVQAGLGVGVWFFIGAFLLRSLLLKRRGAMFFCIALGITFVNNAISNRYGFLYDKYFWLLLTLLTVWAGLRRE